MSVSGPETFRLRVFGPFFEDLTHIGAHGFGVVGQSRLHIRMPQGAMGCGRCSAIALHAGGNGSAKTRRPALLALSGSSCVCSHMRARHTHL
jgi:hypothetical protein